MTTLRDEDVCAVSPLLLTWLQTETSHPATQPLDFDACFGGNLAPDARALLQLATVQRNKLIEVLGRPGGGARRPDPRNVTSAVEAYLPSLWSIVASLEACSSVPIKLTSTKLEFKWTSSLMKTPKEWTFTVLIFEVCFVLSIRALAHRDTARVLLQGDAGAYIAASKELRLAAGIFELVATRLIPRWASPPSTRPPEVWSAVNAAFANMCLADAQRIAAAKSFAAGTTPSVVAKLLLGTSDKLEFATRALQSLDKATFDGLSPIVLEELGAFPPILKGLAANEMAHAAHAKEEYGRAAGFARSSVRLLRAITALGKTLQGLGFPRWVEEARARAETLCQRYDQEVAQVYFCAVPAEMDWPTATFIVSAIPYEMPDAPIVSFSELPLPKGTIEKRTRGLFSSWWEEAIGAKGFVGPAGGAAGGSAGPDEPLLAPAGVDEAVFAALPKDVQLDVQRDAIRTQGTPL